MAIKYTKQINKNTMTNKYEKLKSLGLPNACIYLVLTKDSAAHSLLGNQCTRLLELVTDIQMDGQAICEPEEGFIIAIEPADNPDVKIYRQGDGQALMKKFAPQKGKGMIEFLKKFTLDEDAGF